MEDDETCSQSRSRSLGRDSGERLRLSESESDIKSSSRMEATSVVAAAAV